MREREREVWKREKTLTLLFAVFDMDERGAAVCWFVYVVSPENYSSQKREQCVCGV